MCVRVSIVQACLKISAFINPLTKRADQLGLDFHQGLLRQN